MKFSSVHRYQMNFSYKYPQTAAGELSENLFFRIDDFSL